LKFFPLPLKLSLTPGSVKDNIDILRLLLISKPPKCLKVMLPPIIQKILELILTMHGEYILNQY